MSRSTGKKNKELKTILPELTAAVFLTDSFNESLQKTLDLFAENTRPFYAECRSKKVDERIWTLTSAWDENSGLIIQNNNRTASAGHQEFYKPGLDVIDEVWLTELTDLSDPLLPGSVREKISVYALCLQVAFSNGRNDIFRLFYDDLPKTIKKYEKKLNKLLPEIAKILRKKYSVLVLERSEQQYRRLFYEDLNPNFIASPDGFITDCNRAFIDLFGFKNRKAALQSNFNERFTNYMHQVFFWEALHRGEKINNHEMSATTHNGSNVYILLKIVARYDNEQNLKEFVGYIQDITQRKQTEVALRKSEERYRSLIETTNDWIWEIDEHYCFTYSSLKIQTILGYELNTVLGKSIFDLMPESRREASEEQLKKVADEQKAFVNQEHAFEDKSGDIAIFETSGIPLFSNSGIFQGYRGIAKDITERKKTEKEIAKLNEELENKVIERTKMLQIANKELEAFSYSVSHDLRAPLRSIDGFSQALLEDYEDLLDETGKNYLSRVRTAAQRMSTLIEDMIKLARVSRASIDKKEINLSQIAGSIATQLEESETGRDAEFLIEPGMHLTGDANLMKVALQNLMENAWKFTSKNDNTKIEVGSDQMNGETVYYVKDNGAGFDMNYAKKLFSPFQRLHKESDFPGTGIGLSTVQRIIHRHLGKIWAEGATGEGAVFYFTLNSNSNEENF